MSLQVYWNNICLINRLEESTINDIRNTHPEAHHFNFNYYGLGRKASISQQLTDEIQSKKMDCDILVSTDTDVFHNPFYTSYFNGSKPNIETFITIPLVIVINTHRMHPHDYPHALSDFLDPKWEKLFSFGGIHNSAGQMLLKCVHDLYGPSSVKTLCDNAVISTMPAQAFQRVLSSEVSAAIVPTIFANRCGTNGLRIIWPKEGAVGIPSYVYFKPSVREEDKQLFKCLFLSQYMQTILRDAGDILPSDLSVTPSELITKNNCRILLPREDMLKHLDYKQFHKQLASYVRLND